MKLNLCLAITLPCVVYLLLVCSVERNNRLSESAMLLKDYLHLNFKREGFASQHGTVSPDRDAFPRIQFLLKDTRVTDVDCRALFEGDLTEENRARILMNETAVQQIPPQTFMNMTKDCSTYRKLRGFVTSALTPEERDFPIAYSLLMFKDVEQVERLLRAIYRPQNMYCIHVDKKSPDDIHKAMTAITGCFPNMLIASPSVNVTWGTYSVLEPELMCMKMLWKYKSWKYFINLTGQEYPLKTNIELVGILTAYNGANDIEGTIKR